MEGAIGFIIFLILKGTNTPVRSIRKANLIKESRPIVEQETVDIKLNLGSFNHIHFRFLLV